MNLILVILGFCCTYVGGLERGEGKQRVGMTFTVVGVGLLVAGVWL